MSSRQERVDRYAKAVWEVILDRWTSALGEASKAVGSDKKLAATLPTPANRRLTAPLRSKRRCPKTCRPKCSIYSS
jgi:hypothetical protein